MLEHRHCLGINNRLWLLIPQLTMPNRDLAIRLMVVGTLACVKLECAA